MSKIVFVVSGMLCEWTETVHRHPPQLLGEWYVWQVDDAKPLKVAMRGHNNSEGNELPANWVTS